MQDQIITIGGLVTSIQRKMSRQGAPWAIVTIEDLDGAVDVMFYSQTYANVATQLTEDAVVIVRGRVDKREDVARLVALDMTIPDVASAPRGPLVISMPVSRCTPPTVERLKDVLRSYPGTTEVHLSLDSPGKKTVMRLEDALRVALTPALSADLKALLGASCLS
jgi:DNA polymerase-3 subunit alpha